MFNFETGGQVDAVFTGLRKAFDSVNLKILLNKLEVLGIHGLLLNLFDFYLSNRQ